MIIDVHTHIFPPEIRNARSRFMDKEDAFKSIYSNEKARMVSAEELVRHMDETGVDLSVTFGFPWNSIDTARMANDYVLESIERFPDRLIGFACVYPGVPGVQKELDRCLTSGMKGVGELAFYTDRLSADSMLDVMKPVLEVCRDHSAPIMLHANETVGHEYPGKSQLAMRDMYRFLKAVAPQPVILAHFGGGLFFYELMKKEVPAALAHVSYDTAASPFLYRDRVYSLASEICGSNRILFGSDYPLISPKRYFKEMSEAGLDPSDITKICGENARTLLSV